MYVLPSRRLGGSLAIQLGMLSTRLDETDEYHPFGTGRTFSYSDFVAGLAYGRRWTDKLLIGAGVKYVREDLGSQVGGPITSATLVDLGSIYYLGYGSVRIATSLSNFGAEMTPSGSYVSPYSGETRSYDGFDPPIQFRYGLAFEAIENAQQRLTVATEIVQPADNAQRIKAGLEWTWQRRYSLRGGYNFNSDVMRLSGRGRHRAAAAAGPGLDRLRLHRRRPAAGREPPVAGVPVLMAARVRQRRLGRARRRPSSAACWRTAAARPSQLPTERPR